MLHTNSRHIFLKLQKLNPKLETYTSKRAESTDRLYSAGKDTRALISENPAPKVEMVNNPYLCLKNIWESYDESMLIRMSHKVPIGRPMSYFFRSLSRLTFTNFRPDLSPPPLPKEKLPPGGNSRLPAAWNGDGF